jgi:hypothetical protein
MQSRSKALEKSPAGLLDSLIAEGKGSDILFAHSLVLPHHHGAGNVSLKMPRECDAIYSE